MWRMSFQVSQTKRFSLHIIPTLSQCQKLLNDSQSQTCNIAASNAARHIKLKGGPLFSCDRIIPLACFMVPMVL